ncbi:MAG: phosphoribosyltransferase family protein [bacterium]
MHNIRNIINWCLSIIFQERCLGCRRNGEILCALCIARLRQAEREMPSGINACYDYRDPVVRNAIWSLKYYKHKYLGEVLGKLIYENMIEDISDLSSLSRGQSILVVPVPISANRNRKRGYNQAKSIAQSFCLASGKETLELRDDLAIKILDTEPQARIANRAKRLRNIKDAFNVIRPEVVKGRIVIIIDDVTTTGATISEVMRVVKSSGAKKVLGYAFAH